MIFKQVFDTKTSTYTYLIASAKGREAVIIDPVLENVDSYINLLKELDLRLVKVIDTHIHADHVTGATKLKKATSCATIMGEHTPADAVEIKVKDNDRIYIDDLSIKSIYTPGHTSESYSFLLNNHLFSGDALLINEESRTDTYPVMDISEDDTQIAHEASVSKVNEDQIFYLQSRGIPEIEAMKMVVNGFLEPMVKKLPLEYSVEFQRLVELELEGSVG